MNEPFRGALVPASRYRTDHRVAAVMVEVNRDVYLDPSTFEPNPEFRRIAVEIMNRCVLALTALAP